MSELITRIEKNPNMTYYAVTKDGDLQTNAPSEGPNAVTWGVFPGKEIVQPTIVETISFLAWKDEAFRLGEDWAKCHPSGSVSREVIGNVVDTWYLLNIGIFITRSACLKSGMFANVTKWTMIFIRPIASSGSSMGSSFRTWTILILSRTQVQRMAT